LDPERADASTKQARVDVYEQRLLEVKGGHAAVQFQSTGGFTAGYLLYLHYRNAGFRMLPLQASKAPKYTAIFMTGLGTMMVLRSYCLEKLGDTKHYNYLLANRSAILAGNKSYENEQWLNDKKAKIYNGYLIQLEHKS